MAARLTRVLLAALLGAAGADASIIPVVDTRTPDEILRFDRSLELDNASLRVRITPDQGLIPRASLEVQQVLTDAVRVTYTSQVGLGGVPDLSETDALGAFAPTVWNSSNVNLTWRHGWRWSGRLHAQLRTESRDTDLFHTQTVGTGAEVSRPLGPYAIRLGATAENRYESDREIYARQRVGLGVSRSLQEFPLWFSMEPSLQRETVHWRPYDASFTPRVDASVGGRLDDGLAWQAGGSYQEQLDSTLAPTSNGLRYFTRVDWKLNGDVRLRTDAEYTGNESFRQGATTSSSEQVRVRFSPQIRLNELFNANFDFLQRFDSTQTRDWEPAETSVYFSLSGRF